MIFPMHSSAFSLYYYYYYYYYYYHMYATDKGWIIYKYEFILRINIVFCI